MELVVLDPDEVAGDRVEVEIQDWIKEAGVDWGDAQIEAYMAEAAKGQLPVDFRVPNRTITIPFNLRDKGVTLYEQIRGQIQAKVALFQREGGWIKRETAVGPVYADVVSASLRLGGSNFAVMRDLDMDAVLTLETLPEFYGDWITLSGTFTSTGELALVVHGVKGDYPGRLRMEMDNATAFDQRGMLWGIRCRHFSEKPTAQCGYDPGDLTPLDAATTFGAAMIHANLAANWTPLFSTLITGGVGQMTHTGTYEVWVRAQTSSDPPPDLRIVWDVGDLALPVENPAVSMTGPHTYDVKLGQVRLDPVGLGDHRWGGSVQARGAVGGENISVNRLWLVPVDEGYGELRAPVSGNLPITGYSARDEFNQAVGGGSDPLTGKTLPVGGTWAGSGDADDFFIEDAAGTLAVAFGTETLCAHRTAGSDSAVNNGRFVVAGTPVFTNVVAQVDFKRGSYSTPTNLRTNWTGVLARYVDTSNYLFAGVGATDNVLMVEARVAGAVVVAKATGPLSLTGDQWYTVRLKVDTAGNYTVWFYPRGGSPGDPMLTGVSSALATGGALDDGKAGFYDMCLTSLGATGPTDIRSFDNFGAWLPDPDAVMFGSQSTMLTTDGQFREDLFGASWSPISEPVGDLPRIPPSGAEGRPVEFFVKISRGALDQSPDPTPDSFGLVPSYRPCHLFVPGG